MVLARVEPTIVTAIDLMTPRVLGVHPDMSVKELADFLAENEISGAPVLDDDEKLIGVVSATDIAEKSRPEVDFTLERSDPRFYVRSFDDTLDVEEMRSLHIENEEMLVRDIMTPKVITVPAGMPMAEIAREMVSGRIHRVFVTNAEGKMIGIVSALDLLKIVGAAA